LIFSFSFTIASLVSNLNFKMGLNLFFRGFEPESLPKSI
jgi:hypothetical protein